jgi:amino acid adenylation domain-containing protein
MTGPAPKPADLVRRFSSAVRHSPDRTAVHGADGDLTFAELDRRTEALAGVLAAAGVGPGDLVGVGLGRGTGLVAALLAVWRTGAAYVPLDPRYPQDRLEFMARDAGIKVLIAAGDCPFRPPGVGLIDPDSLADPAVSADPARPADSARSADPNPLDLAYLIYTSGSTGRPKAVQITHGAVADLVGAMEAAGLYAEAPRVVGWNASASFDASVQQWIRVCRGDTLVVLDDEHRTDVARLRTLLDTHAVEDLDLTPSHWDVLRSCLLPSDGGDRPALRLFMGGEPVPERTWRELAEARAQGRIEAVNLYGPTECAVDSTAAWISGDGPHIGRPLSDVRALVLDARLRPVAAPDETGESSEMGELYLSGRRLARGYAGRPGLTAERFVADPYASGERMYRTGDLVRRRADGALEFCGRADQQVKLRGYRVELGEIEAAVAGHPAVSAAVAALYQDPSLGVQLVAYYVAGAPLDPAELRAHCAAALPEHMVPAVFQAIDAVPLTGNGKVDRERLPAPDREQSAQLVEPQGVFEEFVAGVWSEVLGRDKIGAEDDFFALGGYSLVALRVVARLRDELGLAMSTKEVYQHPRLRDLVAHIAAKQAAAPAATAAHDRSRTDLQDAATAAPAVH